MIEFQGKLAIFEFNHWQYHVPVSDEISGKMMDSNHRRVLIWIENEGPFHMALMKAKDYWYILINQELRNRFKLNEKPSFPIKIDRDHSKYGHEMPEELQVLMDQDEEGASYFRSLTPGSQRMMVYTVTKVKSPESRMKKALAIIHHLKLAKGILDYKQLNELIKYYNKL
ncbi:bacteriocin resistance YdeI/OmpD-like protein [Algoriphagus ratkowskyi]|uniref:Bacteriocin resistance YdeI/OmpD-like protein n=1 Tax=Algoriphagus ratkowskyi TaxID=57028 RepID=A0A2W7RB46_9BACT|nr:YdeI/OmpD-associated family protein [Algoriphagus ratkowskyi]PZX55470.1 bacteriocin resistance YdeI/OmpD-like protein [Algoriphagus ratkowskyi]TXD79613.1 YdeI/OmpD-associated family protein [Algoriphagus ratkowskyi]